MVDINVSKEGREMEILMVGYGYSFAALLFILGLRLGLDVAFMIATI
jgi:hypothetical protein